MVRLLQELHDLVEEMAKQMQGISNEVRVAKHPQIKAKPANFLQQMKTTLALEWMFGNPGR